MVGRTLHEFQVTGIIDLHTGHVVVRDLDRLRVIAREQVNTRSRTRVKPVESGNDPHARPHATARAATHVAPSSDRRERDNG